ncbi:unnamed protein product, partial [Eruca vesicaria subsp. sativa]|nr:unnamed protein product [Eruca vesicaria subsp. sativa]
FLKTIRCCCNHVLIASVHCVGSLFLNATSGTHVYFDKETTPGEVNFNQLVARDTGIPSAAPLLRGYPKAEPLTICELNSFTITAPTQELTSYALESYSPITDDTVEGTFVWFDGVMTKLHGLRASAAGQMLAEQGVNPEESGLPPFIAEIEGETYTFQVRVTAYNFSENHKTLTITRIVDDIDFEPLPDVDEDL